MHSPHRLQQVVESGMFVLDLAVLGNVDAVTLNAAPAAWPPIGAA